MISERKRDMAIHWHERGVDEDTISRLLGIPVSEVRAIVGECGL